MAKKCLQMLYNLHAGGTRGPDSLPLVLPRTFTVTVVGFQHTIWLAEHRPMKRTFMCLRCTSPSLPAHKQFAISICVPCLTSFLVSISLSAILTIYRTPITCLIDSAAIRPCLFRKNVPYWWSVVAQRVHIQLQRWRVRVLIQCCWRQMCFQGELLMALL